VSTSDVLHYAYDSRVRGVSLPPVINALILIYKIEIRHRSSPSVLAYYVCLSVLSFELRYSLLVRVQVNRLVQVLKNSLVVDQF
jgi:hypothetical protein